MIVALISVIKCFILFLQIQASNGEVTITNDGATILKQINVIHPAAKMVINLIK